MASLTPPVFAVTGTGRCGTGYAGAVLNACGLHVGHERWFTAVPNRVFSRLDGDSSWLAIPYIESGAWSGPVVHITRHPVDVVRSFVGLGFPDWLSARYEPEAAAMPQPQAAVEMWARWNQRCAAVADVTIRAEDLMDRLADVADVIGRPLDKALAAAVPRTVNHRRRGQVNEREVWRLLDGRAEPFGYSP